MLRRLSVCPLRTWLYNFGTYNSVGLEEHAAPIEKHCQERGHSETLSGWKHFQQMEK